MACSKGLPPSPAISLGLRPSNTDHKFAGTGFAGRHVCLGLLMQQNWAAVLPETALGELIPCTIRGGNLLLRGLCCKFSFSRLGMISPKRVTRMKICFSACCAWITTILPWWPVLLQWPWGHLRGVCSGVGMSTGAKGFLKNLSLELGAGNTSPSSGGEPSSTAPLCWSSTAAEVDVFNFGIRDGNLQGAAGALEAEQEQAGAPRTGSAGKEVNNP